MKDEIPRNQKNRAIILLLILIAIGGIVLYGKNEPERLKNNDQTKQYAPK